MRNAFISAKNQDARVFFSEKTMQDFFQQIPAPEDALGATEN